MQINWQVFIWWVILVVNGLKLTSHGILHYLWSGDLSKSFSQLILSTFTFSQYFFQYILPGGKVWGYPILLILWFINFKDLFSKYEKTHRNLRFCSYSLKKIINGKLYFLCSVWNQSTLLTWRVLKICQISIWVSSVAITAPLGYSQ